MEKFKEVSNVQMGSDQGIQMSDIYIQKLATLRAEIDQANAKADEYKLTMKQLESDHIQKDHELHSLQQKVKTMEDQLEKTEIELKTASNK